MNRIIVFVFVTFFFPLMLSANVLEIRVLQKGSGDPVQGATVAVLETADYANTDERGFARIENIKLPATLKILNIGYETLQQTITSFEKNYEIFLSPLRYAAESVEVVEDRIEEKVSKVSLSIEELNKAPGGQGDPLKVIQSLPGVVTVTEGSGVMLIRGSEPYENIVLVDRAPIGYLFHFGGLQSTINPNMVKDFNMFLGGFPVNYGESVGGVLDIKLKKPKTDRIHQKYSIGTYQSSLFIEGPVGKANGSTGFMLGARRSYIDFLLTPEQMTGFLTGDGSDDKVVTVPKFYDVQAVVTHNINKGELSAKYFSSGDEIALQINDGASADPELIGQMRSTMGYNSLTLDWQQHWGNGFSHVAPLNYLVQTSEFQIGSDQDGNPFFANSKMSEINWQPEIAWQITDTDQLEMGSIFTYVDIPLDVYISRPPRFDETEFNLTLLEKFKINEVFKGGEIGPYVKYNKQWNSRLTTRTGLRYTQFRASGGINIDVWSPRATVEYQALEKTLLIASWGLYRGYPQSLEWIKGAGNPNLQLARSEHRIIGVTQQINRIWSAKVEAWHKPMSDLVVYLDELSPPNNYQNQGSGENYGADVLIRREMHNGKMGWLSYSYLRADRTNRITRITQPFSGEQKHSLTLVWSQSLQGSWNKWDVGFRFRANSGKPFRRVVGVDTSVPNVIQPVYAAQASRLPNFYQLDIRWDREFRFNRWKASYYIDLNNVTNAKNVSAYDYGGNYERIDNPRETISMGFTPYFGIEVEI